MDEEFAFAPPPRNTPPGPLQRAYAWAQRGRFARVKEIALFALPGAALVLLAFETSTNHWVSDPLSLLLGLCGVLAIGFGLLPSVRRTEPPPANPKSKRASR